MNVVSMFVATIITVLCSVTYSHFQRGVRWGGDAQRQKRFSTGYGQGRREDCEAQGPNCRIRPLVSVIEAEGAESKGIWGN